MVKHASASPEKLMVNPMAATDPSASLEWRPQLMSEGDRERLEDLEQIVPGYNSDEGEEYDRQLIEGVKPGKTPLGNPKVINKGRVEYVSMAELKELEDERKAKRELLQIQLDAESQMKRRVVRDHFKNLYVPFDTQPDPKVHEGFIKQVLRAMEIIIKGEGDVKWVEEECRRTWLEERE